MEKKGVVCVEPAKYEHDCVPKGKRARMEQGLRTRMLWGFIVEPGSLSALDSARVIHVYLESQKRSRN